jgi:hypothetical protein
LRASSRSIAPRPARPDARPGETLHRFTEQRRRRPELGPPERAAIAAHLRAYAELRYAGAARPPRSIATLAASARRI